MRIKNNMISAKSWGIVSTDRGLTVEAQVLIKRYLRERHTVYDKRGAFYEFRNGFWQEKDRLTIIKLLRAILDKFVPNVCDAGVISDIKTFLPIICPDFNLLRPATNFINLTNGLLDLNTFELVPHDRQFASLVQLPFDYNPDAECPKFHKFLNEIFRGDNELKLLTQEIMGYCLSPSTQAQKCFIFYSDGSSGKSVLCSILHRLAGGDANVSSVTLSNLNAKFTRAQLYGKVVNISTENENSNFNSEALKSITSGDPIQIENKYEKPFTAKIIAKLVFAMNNLPKPSDRTFALYRRLCLVPFLTKFVDNPHEGTNELKRNPNIEAELLEELPGILAWCIEGLKRLVANNYQFTKSIEAEKLMLEFRKDTTPVYAFIDECISESQARMPERISTNELYSAYNRWLEVNGIRGLLGKREFLKHFRAGLAELNLPLAEGHSGKVRFFKNIYLSERTNQQEIDADDVLEDDNCLETEDVAQYCNDVVNEDLDIEDYLDE